MSSSALQKRAAGRRQTAPLRAIASHAQHRLSARQLTGTAMLRPAASPWRRVAHRAGAATTRRRCINISATNSSAEPAFEQRTNIDAAATPVVSPGMRPRYRPAQPITDNCQTHISRSLGRPSLSSPSLFPLRKPSLLAVVPWSA